jgi:hypothetical protein
LSRTGIGKGRNLRLAYAVASVEEDRERGKGRAAAPTLFGVFGYYGVENGAVASPRRPFR